MSVDAGVWQGERLSEEFARLTGLLRDQQALWRPFAFTHLQLPWERDHPELSRRLRALPLAQAEACGADDDAAAALCGELLPVARTVAERCRLPGLPRATPADGDDPGRELRDVPGRKQRQIAAFAARLPQGAAPVLEWCAGKAHLGRHIAAVQRCEVTALEHDAGLVAAGRALAEREGLPVRMQQVDVLQPAAADCIAPGQRIVALHACGDLHRQLLRHCAERHPHTLLLAPCCYQLIAAERHQPLSRAGMEAALPLTRDELRTAVQGTVTSPPRVQQRRRQLQAWRLGFDLLQRELRGSDEYLPTPALPQTVLREGFAAFCRQVAEHKRLPLPAAVDYAWFERAGGERLREVAALDLPRILFRRALELWLALDGALLLCEAGYRVELGAFCERRLTPRNIVLRAQCPA